MLNTTAERSRPENVTNIIFLESQNCSIQKPMRNRFANHRTGHVNAWGKAFPV